VDVANALGDLLAGGGDVADVSQWFEYEHNGVLQRAHKSRIAANINAAESKLSKDGLVRVGGTLTSSPATSNYVCIRRGVFGIFAYTTGTNVQRWGLRPIRWYELRMDGTGKDGYALLHWLDLDEDSSGVFTFQDSLTPVTYNVMESLIGTVEVPSQGITDSVVLPKSLVSEFVAAEKSWRPPGKGPPKSGRGRKSARTHKIH